MNIKKLIKECQKNNRNAQSELFHLYKDVLFSLSLKYCKNYNEAEDNLQDTFITIFKKINQYNFKGSFDGWVKRIAINKAIDKYKKSSTPALQIDENRVADTTIEPEMVDFRLDELLIFIQELPDQYRLVFSLYELDSYSHKEIATMLNISEGTSKSNLHRAKVLLKTKITALRNPQKKILVRNER